jgi:hypothetical protein
VGREERGWEEVVEGGEAAALGGWRVEGTRLSQGAAGLIIGSAFPSEYSRPIMRPRELTLLFMKAASL